MKINIVTGPFCSLPPVGFGAGEKVWYDCGKYFSSQGHDVTFFARIGPGEAAHEQVDGLTVNRFRGFFSSGKIIVDLFLDLIYSVNMLRRLPKADITVVSSFWLPIIAPLRKRKIGKIVYKVGRYPKGQLKYYKGLDRFSFVTKAVYDAGIEQGDSIKSRSRINPNPINTNVFYNKTSEGRQKTTIIYTGRIAPEKGIDLLIRAFAILYKNNPELKLQLVGSCDMGTGGGGDEYIRQLNTLAGDAPVEFITPIRDPQKLADQLRAADIYVYPSCADKGEAFGVAPLEAMGVGIPVIVSDLACFRDFVTDGSSGLVFDHRSENAVEQLADKILLLLNDEEYSRKISAEGAEQASKFSIKHIAENYLKDFRELISCHH